MIIGYPIQELNRLSVHHHYRYTSTLGIPMAEIYQIFLSTTFNLAIRQTLIIINPAKNSRYTVHGRSGT